MFCIFLSCQLPIWTSRLTLAFRFVRHSSGSPAWTPLEHQVAPDKKCCTPVCYGLPSSKIGCCDVHDDGGMSCPVDLSLALVTGCKVLQTWLGPGIPHMSRSRLPQQMLQDGQFPCGCLWQLFSSTFYMRDKSLTLSTNGCWMLLERTQINIEVKNVLYILWEVFSTVNYRGYFFFLICAILPQSLQNFSKAKAWNCSVWLSNFAQWLWHQAL